ncbi:DUF4386 domain-containing protein [Enterococcus sp. AZ007]|uniref:DUF4386 domain-containing protein n=1 Tax=Enterococcus sp. AZ007 TaxID=2774839 RepID=UPI003F218372
MEKQKNKLIVIGMSFIFATISYLVGSNFIETAFKLITLGEQFKSISIIFGMLLEFMNIIFVIIIGVLLSSISKCYNSKISTIYLSSRIVEGFFLALSILCVFPLFFGKKITTCGANLIDLYSTFFQIGMLSLGLGSIALMVLFLKKKIVPKPLCILGIISYVSLAFSSILELSNIFYNFTTLLYVPGSIFEIVFPIWLIKKRNFEVRPE